MVELARTLTDGRPNCRFEASVRPDLSQFENDTFDFVYSSAVLQHVPSKAIVRSYIAEFARVTRPDGCFAFGIPGPAQGVHRLQPRPRAYVALARLGVRTPWLRRLRLHSMVHTGMTAGEVETAVQDGGGAVITVDAALERYFCAPA